MARLENGTSPREARFQLAGEVGKLMLTLVELDPEYIPDPKPFAYFAADFVKYLEAVLDEPVREASLYNLNDGELND